MPEKKDGQLDYFLLSGQGQLRFLLFDTGGAFMVVFVGRIW